MAITRGHAVRTGLILLVPLSLAIALAVGSAAIDLPTLWRVVTGAETGLPASMVLELRWPRAVAAFTVGGLLALSGTLLQVLLRNPLADPYILGVSGGASVAALSVLLAGVSGAWVSGSALAGSLLALLTVFGLSHGRGVWNEMRVLLTGVMIAAGCGAVVSLMLALAPQNTLTSLLFWLLGDLGQGPTPWWGLGVLLVSVGIVFPYGRALNLYARGEDIAAALGENAVQIRYGLFFIASLLAATAVTLAGSIGFIGLVIPHLLRLFGRTDHRQLLIDAPLAGGALLVLADTVARTVVAPSQLPVGGITAIFGVPVFLFLLARDASFRVSQ